MRYFIDTEFIERGPKHPVELVSVGVVREDGRRFYAISTEFKARHASTWVKENVLAHLPPRNPDPYASIHQKWLSLRWMKRDQIRDGLLAFVGDDPEPEFWGWCCGFDYVLVSQLVGFDRWPNWWPYYFRDIQQLADERGIALNGVQQQPTQHDALADAQGIRHLWKHLSQGLPSGPA